MGLHLGAPSLEVQPEGDHLETAERMWPIIKGTSASSVQVLGR